MYTFALVTNGGNAMAEIVERGEGGRIAKLGRREARRGENVPLQMEKYANHFGS